jgi:hypothetical protein
VEDTAEAIKDAATTTTAAAVAAVVVATAALLTAAALLAAGAARFAATAATGAEHLVQQAEAEARACQSDANHQRSQKVFHRTQSPICWNQLGS